MGQDEKNKESSIDTYSNASKGVLLATRFTCGLLRTYEKLLNLRSISGPFFFLLFTLFNVNDGHAHSFLLLRQEQSEHFGMLTVELLWASSEY